MGIFRKIFGAKSKSSNQEGLDTDSRGKYMPEIKLPIDERFTINFKANGGKFLYCENMQEINESLKEILKENKWEDKYAYVLDERLKDLFKGFNFNCTKKASEAVYFFSTCEYLISDDGSLLISSNQIAEKKIKE